MTTPSKTVETGGVRLHLSEPDRTEQSWIGQDEVLRQLLACWLVVDPQDRPLSPRLTGPPGIGKTTLAMAAARLRKQPLYITQCTADTRPEDLLVTPVLAESGKIAYHPLGRGSWGKMLMRMIGGKFSVVSCELSVVSSRHSAVRSRTDNSKLTTHN